MDYGPRIIDPNAKLRRDIERIGRTKELRAQCRKIRRNKTNAYLYGHWHYQLMCGEKKVGEPVVMTGAEARMKTKACEDDFVRRLKLNPAARLYRWVWLEREKFTQDWFNQTGVRK